MKISVGMAVHNGEQFLREQLNSILPQLNELDEIIIINDASSDGSLEVCKSYNDPRIKIYSNEINCGIVRSFEQALYKCSGDIIILSDQDDIWFPNKVKEIKLLLCDENYCAVVSDAIVINSRGKEIHSSFFQLRNSGPGFWKNFYKNTYLGCAMAITNNVKEWVLPFPKYIPMHDEWIGMVCHLLGRVKFLNMTLFAYRRHESNVTDMFPSKIRVIIYKRMLHIRAIIFEFPSLWFQYHRRGKRVLI